MPTKNFPTDTFEQATMVLAACKQIDPTLNVGNASLAAFGTQLDQAESIQAQIAELELQLIDLRVRRDDQLAAIWEVVKRARATIKGIYGDDSSQYEMMGGTRMSERKKNQRRAGNAAPTV